MPKTNIDLDKIPKLEKKGDKFYSKMPISKIGDQKISEEKLALLLTGTAIAGVLIIYGFFPTIYSIVILNSYSVFTIGIILFVTLVAIIQRARGLEKGRFRFELLLILAGIISILIATSIIPTPLGLDSMTFFWFYLLTFACAFLVAIGFYLAIPAKATSAKEEVVVKKEAKGDKIISTKKALTYVVIFTIISEIVGIILINYNLIVAVSFIALGIGAIGAGIMGALMPEPQKKS